VQGYQDWSEHLSDIKEMSEGTSAKVGTTITIAVGLNWVDVAYMSVVPQPDRAIFGKGESVSTISGRQDAIEHIDAGLYGSDDVG
jgi:hypothetical protein